MRQRFEAQLTLGSTPISEIEIPTKSRDEFPAFLRAMQYIYCNEDLSSRIFSLLESIICSKRSIGRPCMDLWSIFVLAGARLCLNADYDRLTIFPMRIIYFAKCLVFMMILFAVVSLTGKRLLTTFNYWMITPCEKST